ncbi:MAG: ABC transporter substrate-binding protein [Rhodobacteraceae bacterium]|nr:ABC transporter substrate-binding protein [Paracoccaceae bacterium]
MWGSVRISDLIMAVGVALGLASGATAMPARVVSMNLCTDQLAMLLAAPGQLVSVSFLAADPLSSAMVAEAAGYPKNHGQAEEVFLLHPDLVLAGTYTTRASVDLLRRLGVKVAIIPAPDSLDSVGAAMRAVGAALGREAAADAMAGRFEADLAALRARPLPPDRAALYAPSGYTSGTGTIADDILRAAGFRNVAAEAGIIGYARLPLERLVLATPDALVTSQHYPGASRPEAILHHPVLRDMIARLGPPQVAGPDWDCGTPKLIDAIAALQAAHPGARP